ncbi:hypothetical protein V1525DRAFT_399073 [Lipomyces kononenkoae]|uniref:Uncharacterized protein n=1 Tax=Lipomyces kononenkoae TaxID=34357 RepID=A0ACC3T542_LIPKO
MADVTGGLDLPDSPRSLSDRYLPPALVVGSSDVAVDVGGSVQPINSPLVRSTTAFGEYSPDRQSVQSLNLPSSTNTKQYSAEEKYDNDGKSISSSQLIVANGTQISPESTLPATSEVYDPWQGDSDQLVTPAPVRADLQFPLVSTLGGSRGVVDPDDDDERVRESTRRLQLMLSATPPAPSEEENQISVDELLHDSNTTAEEKRQMLQHMFIVAASNGDMERIRRILLEQDASAYVDVNMPDEEGTCGLIYAACFGHADVVRELVNNGADIDQQDKFKWSPLMWATTNNHAKIVRFLLENGASPDVKSATGRTARDFVDRGSEISDLIGPGSRGDFELHHLEDYYVDSNKSPLRYGEQLGESDLKRRMLMESAFNLDVDFSKLAIDETVDDGLMEETEFDWDHCLPDQMFVFSAEDISKILDLAITRMQPLRSPFQKPVPANVLFLSARFAHYYGTPELLNSLLLPAIERINEVIEMHEDDMAFLSFWLSNVTLLLYYLRKDTGMMEGTIEHQVALTELVSDIVVLFIRDAERRLDRILDSAILDHETIPGLDDIQFQREWRIFRAAARRLDSNRASSPGAVSNNGPDLAQIRPPSSTKMALPSPRNVTSLLSSTLFVLDLYEIHPVIILQVIGQIFYWLNATIFNRIMTNRKYLARTKAMQIRLNVSAIEDWARANNRQPLASEPGIGGSGSSMLHESVADLAKRHLSHLVQLLQWLQCFSSLGDDTDGLIATLQQLPCLTAEQLLHVVNRYRTEVGEDRISKNGLKYLRGLEQQQSQSHNKGPAARISRLFNQTSPTVPIPLHSRNSSQSHDLAANNRSSFDNTDSSKTTASNNAIDSPSASSSKFESAFAEHSVDANDSSSSDDEQPRNTGVFIDVSVILPFVLPTTTEMLVTWGAGIGGTNRAQAQRHVPFLPQEYVAKLDATSSLSTGVPSIKSGMTGTNGNSVGRMRGNSSASHYYNSMSPTKRGADGGRADSFESIRTGYAVGEDDAESEPGDTAAEYGGQKDSRSPIASK